MAKFLTDLLTRERSALFSRTLMLFIASESVRTSHLKMIFASSRRRTRWNTRAAIERHPTDVVLLEGELLTGVDSAIPELLRIAPDIKLIVQTVAVDKDQTVELYRRGIRGILSRSISPDLLVKCVRCIDAGETWIDNQSTNWVIESYRARESALLSPSTQLHLSPKQTAIITCITKGMRNKEIAFQLGTTEQVIKNYLCKIYDKLGVTDRLELALYCLHNKIIKADADDAAVVQKLLAK